MSTWLFGVAALVVVMIVVGGLTRLTQSGLSIVRWEPVSGIIPPLNEEAWLVEFEAYQAHPEYQLVNRGMDLDAFKGIYLWEYLHRLLGRVIGLALVVPLGWFWWKRAVPRGYAGRLVVLALLVGLQGAIGWWMVRSGLVDRPDVAHERLAVHLLTALVLLAGLLWVALDLRAASNGRAPVDGRPTRWIVPFSVLLLLQITLGAFVAGMRAGFILTTWPTMGGAWVPDEVGRLTPWWSNLVDNPATVQFVHRWLAVGVAAAAIAVARVLHRAGGRVYAWWLGGAVVGQFVLGVFTLVHAVPVALGAAHQAGAVVLFIVTVAAVHWARGGADRRARASTAVGPAPPVPSARLPLPTTSGGGQPA
jgi:cytochrome c oxidase assembly protein subunit 15